MNVNDQFEKLIEDHKINFAKAKITDLDEWGQSLVRTFLEAPGGEPIKWELGDVKIGESYCLKIHDEMIGYLDIMSETQQFMWCTPDHHDSIHPDSASAYLIMRGRKDIKIRCLRDDKTGLRVMDFTLPNGQRFRVSDVEQDGTRVFVMGPL